MFCLRLEACLSQLNEHVVLWQKKWHLTETFEKDYEFHYMLWSVSSTRNGEYSQYSVF